MADEATGLDEFVPPDEPALLLTYELHRPSRDFERHHVAIRDYIEGRWGERAGQPCGRPTWILLTEDSPESVYNELVSPDPGLFDEADRVFVMDLRGPQFAPTSGTTSLPWLPGWLEHAERAHLVIHQAGAPPIHDELDGMLGAVSPAAGVWLVPTDASAREFFDALIGPGSDGPPLVEVQDTLLVAECSHVEQQGVTVPSSRFLQVVHKRQRPSPGLAAVLRRKQDWWRNMNHAWMVSTRQSSGERLTELEAAVAWYDGLFVVDCSSGDMAYRGGRSR